MQLDDRVTVRTPEGAAMDVVLAGLGSRFLARLLDALVQGAIIFVLVAAIAASSADTDESAIAAAVVATLLVAVGYDIAFETLSHGRTPGKRAVGIRVVDLDGEPVGLAPSATRNLVRIVDFLPALYLLGSISIVVTTRDQRLGDLAAGTMVVRDRFGGLRHTHATAPLTVPVAEVAAWDVSAVDADELRLVRHFLERRLALDWPVRTYFATEIAQRLSPKLAGAPPDVHPEYLLEGIVVAKESRS